MGITRVVRASEGIGAALAITVLAPLVSLEAAAGQDAATPSPVAATPVGAEVLAGHWVRIPKAPWGTQSPAAVAVDGDMLVLDERTGRVLFYDVGARTWERRAHLPKRVGNIGPWVWTGEELVVLNELASGRIVAYDPATDAWRTLPVSPLPGHDFAVLADGHIIAAHVDQDSEVDLSRELAMLDLAEGTWSEFPPPIGLERLVDLVWTGSQLLAITVDEAEDLVQVASLDPAAGAWSEASTGPLSWDRAIGVWTGERLVFSGSEQYGSRSDATFDPATMTWTAEGFDCPVSTAAALWTGELLVGTNYHFALDPATGACYRVPGRNRTMGGSAAAVWTGDRVIYWSGGGGEEGELDPYRHDGSAFVFDTGRTGEEG